MRNISKLIFRITALVSVAFLFFLLSNFSVQAATLSIYPNSGIHEVNSTFDVAVMLNTEGKNINAIKIDLLFPANVLQVVSPSVGESAITLWASPPSYSNSAGTIKLEGGFPGGVNFTGKIITKITFRVKSTGSAIVKFQDDSKVFLDDGEATDTLSQTNNGIYSLVLPPPAGPEVVSETHSDQSRWYKNSSVVLKWADPDPALVEEYSYILSDEPNEIPDDIAEGNKNNLSYKDLSDGRHYFHIKALNKDKIWGGTTHYALNIDKAPPAEFAVDIFPASSTVRRNPVIQFLTTDSASSVDYYEIKIISLNNNGAQASVPDSQQMFIEASSSFVAPDLELGRYDVIVRAYDTAGNYRDSIQKLKITTALFQFVDNEGLILKGHIVFSWRWIFITVLILIAVSFFILWYLKHRHSKIKTGDSQRNLPSDVKRKLEELRKLKEKYGKLATMLVLIVSSWWLTLSVYAQENFSLIDSPVITTISRNISNDEIFYAGGKAENSGMKILLYIKNINTGEAFNEEILTNEKGEWFYRHDTFLSEGEYILWAQSKINEQISPPSPQVEMTVNKTALQWGASRISYESLLSIIALMLAVILCGLIFYILHFVKKLRWKKVLFKKEVDEVEDAVHRGFMMLHREIAKELEFIEKAKLKKSLSEEESVYREHLMNDLKKIERHIEKELVDVEKLLD